MYPAKIHHDTISRLTGKSDNATCETKHFLFSKFLKNFYTNLIEWKANFLQTASLLQFSYILILSVWYISACPFYIWPIKRKHKAPHIYLLYLDVTVSIKSRFYLYFFYFFICTSIVIEIECGLNRFLLKCAILWWRWTIMYAYQVNTEI